MNNKIILFIQRLQNNIAPNWRGLIPETEIYRIAKGGYSENEVTEACNELIHHGIATRIISEGRSMYAFHNIIDASIINMQNNIIEYEKTNAIKALEIQGLELKHQELMDLCKYWENGWSNVIDYETELSLKNYIRDVFFTRYINQVSVSSIQIKNIVNDNNIKIEEIQEQINHAKQVRNRN